MAMNHRLIVKNDTTIPMNRAPIPMGDRRKLPIMADWSMAYRLPETTPYPLANAIDDIHWAAMLPAAMPVVVKPIYIRNVQVRPTEKSPAPKKTEKLETAYSTTATTQISNESDLKCHVQSVQWKHCTHWSQLYHWWILVLPCGIEASLFWWIWLWCSSELLWFPSPLSYLFSLIVVTLNQ